MYNDEYSILQGREMNININDSNFPDWKQSSDGHMDSLNRLYCKLCCKRKSGVLSTISTGQKGALDGQTDKRIADKRIDDQTNWRPLSVQSFLNALKSGVVCTAALSEVDLVDQKAVNGRRDRSTDRQRWQHAIYKTEWATIRPRAVKQTDRLTDRQSIRKK